MARDELPAVQTYRWSRQSASNAPARDGRQQRLRPFWCIIIVNIILSCIEEVLYPPGGRFGQRMSDSGKVTRGVTRPRAAQRRAKERTDQLE